MTQQEIVSYLLREATLLTTAAQDILATGKSPGAWMIDVKVPKLSEYEAEIHAQEQQEKLQYEHQQAIELGETA